MATHHRQGPGNAFCVDRGRRTAIAEDRPADLGNGKADQPGLGADHAVTLLDRRGDVPGVEAGAGRHPGQKHHRQADLYRVRLDDLDPGLLPEVVQAGQAPDQPLVTDGKGFPTAVRRNQGQLDAGRGTALAHKQIAQGEAAALGGRQAQIHIEIGEDLANLDQLRLGAGDAGQGGGNQGGQRQQRLTAGRVHAEQLAKLSPPTALTNSRTARKGLPCRAARKP